MSNGMLPQDIFCFSLHSDSSSIPTSETPYHHHRCVLLVALRGRRRVCINTESFLLRPESALMVFPFQFHSVEPPPPDFCWLYITFEMPSLQSLESLRSSGPRRLGVMEIMLLLETARCQLDAGRQLLLPLHLALFLERLAGMPHKKPRAAPRAKAVTNIDLLVRLNEYAIPRLQRPSLGLVELARAMGQSESHLRARFREATGESLGSHLRNLRLNKACGLLRTTSISITEVAERCGFDSIYSFSQTFKAKRGVSPLKYRQGMLQ